MKEDLVAAFGESGIGFQQRCVARIKEEIQSWQIHREEYPVSIGGKETKIDFVATNEHVNLIGECKQRDSRYKAWLFVASSKGSYSKPNVYSVSSIAREKPCIVREETDLYTSLNAKSCIYALEVKKKGRGAKNLMEREKHFNVENISSACDQVTRGQFALMTEEIRENNGGPGKRSVYLSAVITTAKLYYGQYNPLSEELTTEKIEEVPWVLFRHGASDLLWKTTQDDFVANEFDDPQFKEWQKDPDKRVPISIVNFEHLNKFFNCLSEGVKE